MAIASAVLTAAVFSGGLSAVAQEVAELAAPNSVNSAAIINGTIVGADIATNGVNSSDIKENGVHTNDIRDGDVTTADILDGTVGTADILDGTVGAADIGPDAVGASELGANVVGSTELGTITIRSQASLSIAPGATGSVTAACLAGEQVLSGGNDGFGDVYVVASRRSGNGWAVFAHNDSAGTRSVTAHAYCLQP